MLLNRANQFLVAIVVAISCVTCTNAQAPLAFLGTWKINSAQSDLSETRLTFTRQSSGDITMSMMGMSYDFRIDGTPRPSPMSSTATWTETGPRSWKTLYRMNNVDNNIDDYTLSDDGGTLTMRTEVLVPTRMEQTLTFSRAGGGDGLMGEWRATAIQNTDSTMVFSAVAGGTVPTRL